MESTNLKTSPLLTQVVKLVFRLALLLMVAGVTTQFVNVALTANGATATATSSATDCVLRIL
jgi:hypothetical protein